MLRVSDEFDNRRYRVLKELGKGTFGRVVEMEDTKEGKTVAVKVVRAIEKYAREAEDEAEILNAVQRSLPHDGSFPIVRLLRCFEARGHYCLVFETMGPSLYHRLRDIRRTLERRSGSRATGAYFTLEQIAVVARDCFEALAHLHKIKLTHTDLKPENVLLVTPPASKREPPKDYSVALIDFGGATWESQHHSSVVCTRQYRPPEVTLGLGWDQNVDLWSVGCILVELWTGTVLFSTHDEVEHLALMERILGTLPRRLLRNAVFRRSEKTFRHGCLKWPDRAMDRHSEDFVRSQPRLREIIGGECAEDEERNFEPLRWTEEMGHFYDFIWRLLEYLPEHRMSAEAALRHPFLSAVPPRQQRAIAALRVGDACSS